MADECPMVRVGCKDFLSPMEGVEIIGEAATIGEAIGLAAKLRPGLAFVDPDFSAETPDSLQDTLAAKIHVCRELKSLPEALQVIVYAKRNSPADVAAVTLAGADGYIHKSTPLEDLMSAMKRVIAGEPIWIFGLLDSGRADHRFLTALKVVRLTPRDKDILELLLKRYRNKDIAHALHVANQTAKNYVASVLRKLGYHSRDELHELERLRLQSLVEYQEYPKREYLSGDALCSRVGQDTLDVEKRGKRRGASGSEGRCRGRRREGTDQPVVTHAERFASAPEQEEDETHETRGCDRERWATRQGRAQAFGEADSRGNTERTAGSLDGNATDLDLGDYMEENYARDWRVVSHTFSLMEENNDLLTVLVERPR